MIIILKGVLIWIAGYLCGYCASRLEEKGKG